MMRRTFRSRSDRLSAFKIALSKRLLPTVKLPIWTRPCFAHPEHGRRERRRKKHTAWLRNDRQLEAQPPKREQRERLAPALLRRKICSAAFGCRFHNAALTQTVLKGGSKSDRETDDSLTMSAVSSTSRSFQTSTDFAWRLLWRRNKKNKEEDAEKAHRAAVEKKAAKQAAERQAAKKSAEVASQVQQQAAKGTAAAASKATAAAVPVGAVVVLVLLILLLLGIIIFLVSCIFSLFGGVTASLNNPTLEAYVLSLDDSFEQEVRAEMESGDKVDGSFPKTNAYALAVLATGDWVADPLTDEIKEEMARIHDLLYSFKKEEETIKEEATTSGGMGHMTTIHVFKITARKPEDIVPELGISEERQAFLLRQLETLYQLQTIPGIGGGEIITPDSDWIGTGIFQWPLPETGTITSYFGNRVNPITGEPDYHTGTDISVAAGTPILAAADGVVSIANGTDSWGDSYGVLCKARPRRRTGNSVCALLINLCHSWAGGCAGRSDCVCRLHRELYWKPFAF